MNRQYFRDKLAKHKWVKEQQPFTLQDYYFKAQPEMVAPLTGWMREIAEWQNAYLRTKNGELGKMPELIAPFLYLSGPRETGKTYLVQAIIRYMMLNAGFSSVEYVYWPGYVRSIFDDDGDNVNWNASLVIIDDIDGDKPAQNNPSSWKLIQVITPLKNRSKATLVLGNRAIYTEKPELSLEYYMGTTNQGKSTLELRDFASALISAIERRLYAHIYLNRLDPKGGETKPILYQRLRRQAQEQDVKALGFNFSMWDGVEL